MNELAVASGDTQTCKQCKKRYFSTAFQDGESTHEKCKVCRGIVKPAIFKRHLDNNEDGNWDVTGW